MKHIMKESLDKIKFWNVRFFMITCKNAIISSKHQANYAKTQK